VILKLRQTPCLYLVGFMASGKTTVGKMLAERLGWNYVDIDDEIEAAESRPIAEIFDTHGEAEFRRIETAAIARHVRAVACGVPTVMALGGGAVAQPGNAELVEAHGVTIWLSCPFETVLRRVGQNSTRPLARDPKKFEELYHSRQDAYGRSNFRVEIDGDDPAAAVDAILKLPLFS
jgi:shikimate kinase